jgi:alanine-synthesizing transaminase
VATSPGIGFGEHGEDHLRFALVENRHRLRQAVRSIRAFLGRHGVRPPASRTRAVA